MTLIVCVDDKMGMAFNKRRQSRDSEVIKDISSLGLSLYMHERSAALFEGVEIKTASSDECDAYFLEFAAPSTLNTHFERIILYRWNRHYPSDTRFDIPLDNYRSSEVFEFAGSSHENITRETFVYES